MEVPTCKEWRELQIAWRRQVEPQKKMGQAKVINGVKFWEDNFNGIKVLLPA
jgi:hypothetical protein